MNFFIKTFGCQMNVNDSEKIRYLLEAEGLDWTDEEDLADLIVVNSCAVRQKPEEKVFSYIGRFSPGKKVILAGCVAQAERDRIFSRKRKPDYLLGTHQFYRIGQVAKSLFQKKNPGMELGFTRKWHELIPDVQARTSPVTAFVSIMEGCNNFCSYCIVPFTRGREKYRPFPYIMKEVEMLSQNGYREIILLGQNVNSWKDEKEGISFPRLLQALARHTDIRWIRFITSYPGYHDPQLVAVMQENPPIARHLHFPAQSGSSRILRLMERTYTRSRYLEIIRQFRRAMPGFGFSSDFIVGFPGENDRDFQRTLSLMESVKFVSIYSFIYSPRRHTTACILDDKLPIEVKKERLYNLQELQAQIQLKENRRLIGKTVEVLITERHPKKAQEVIGRTETYRVVNFPSPKPLGKFSRVKITEVGAHSLRGYETDENSKS